MHMKLLNFHKSCHTFEWKTHCVFYSPLLPCCIFICLAASNSLCSSHGLNNSRDSFYVTVLAVKVDDLHFFLIFLHILGMKSREMNRFI